MVIYIDTTGNDTTKIALISADRLEVKQFDRSQAEDLSQILGSFLATKKMTLEMAERIVVRQGEGYSSRIRSGIVAANALGYALDIRVSETDHDEILTYDNLLKLPAKKSLVPIYNREPNITLGKKKT